MNGEYIVGMGRFAVAREPAVLSALGLGSCVGLVLYDESIKLGSLAHIMLPDSRGASEDNMKSALLDIKSTSLKSLIKSELDSIALSDAVDVVKDYKDKRTDAVFIEVDDIGKASFKLEMIREFDKMSNIVLIGDVDENLKADLFYQDVYVIDKNPKKEDIAIVIKMIKHKKLLKFADKAIGIMIESLELKGAKKERLIAKMAGGAQMFETSSTLLDIGTNNHKSIKEQLKKYNIPIVAENVGGKLGRTVRFYVENGKFVLKTKEWVKEI